MFDQHQLVPLATLLLIAFGSNLPLGYVRQTSRKYSLRWVICIHASIPLLIAMRLFYDFSWRWIPVTLAFAVFGQIIGGWIRRRVEP